MRKLIHLLLLSFLAGGVAAQSDVQYTHFTFNKLAYNPGYTGAKGSFDAAGMYAAIVIIMVVALAAEYLMTLVENRLAKWRPTPMHEQA